jgi:hypothetical protein
MTLARSLIVARVLSNVSVAVVNALRGGGSAEALVRVFLPALFVMDNRRF